MGVRRTMFNGFSSSEESARLTGFADQSGATHPLPKLAQPALRALAGAGITHLEQLTGYGESEIRQLHGMGPRALETLREALATRGLSFKKETKK